MTERLRQKSVVDQLVYVWRNDLPLFISTDAILHALGRSYDRIIKDVELGLLIDRLSALLTEMHNRLAELDAKYSPHPQMHPMLRDVDVYLTVARTLLGHDVTPHYPENVFEIDGVLALIAQESLASYDLFAETCRQIDFSQFTPRGHYTESDTLQQYFRAMMWLGRTELYLLPPENVADYHTAPTDCAGNMTGWVLHAGTGPIDLAIITAPAPGGEMAAFVGPVMSYYEYTTTDFQRLTDEEWKTTYLSQATRTASYLADEAGEPK